jgi:hypothetical protein
MTAAEASNETKPTPGTAEGAAAASPAPVVHEVGVVLPVSLELSEAVKKADATVDSLLKDIGVLRANYNRTESELIRALTESVKRRDDLTGAAVAAVGGDVSKQVWVLDYVGCKLTRKS